MSRLPAAEDFVKLYTDGACSGNPGPGGWAFILEHPASGKVLERFGAEPNTTNNRMEIEGALRGLELLKRPCRVELVTDSQYLAKGINEWLPGWRANGFRRREGSKFKPLQNDDLWRAVDALLARHQVRVVHVRGHAGHPQNERCDQLAVAAYKALGRRTAPSAMKPRPSADQEIEPRRSRPSIPPEESLGTIERVSASEESAQRDEVSAGERITDQKIETGISKPEAEARQTPDADRTGPAPEAETVVPKSRRAAAKPRTAKPRRSSTRKTAKTGDSVQPEPVTDADAPAPEPQPAQPVRTRSRASSKAGAEAKPKAPARKRKVTKSQPEIDFPGEESDPSEPARWDPDEHQG